MYDATRALLLYVQLFPSGRPVLFQTGPARLAGRFTYVLRTGKPSRRLSTYRAIWG
jgi:hypothetical protein